jgi:hypothetical protein
MRKVTLAAVPSEIMNHPPHSPDLAPSDFRLFGSMKVHPGGQKFKVDDELKSGVLNWLHSQDKTLYAEVTINLPGQWKKVC